MKKRFIPLWGFWGLVFLKGIAELKAIEKPSAFMFLMEMCQTLCFSVPSLMEDAGAMLCLKLVPKHHTSKANQLQLRNEQIAGPWKRLWKFPWTAAQREPTVPQHCKKGKCPTGMCKQEWPVGNSWSNPSTPLGAGQGSAGALCPVLGTALQGRCGLTGQSPEESSKNEQRSSKHDLWGKIGRIGFV